MRAEIKNLARGATGMAGPVALIIATVVALYGRTLDVPFYLDDERALLNNYFLRDLPEVFRHVVSQRGLTNLTFALNYRLSGWSLAPLHLTNMLLHAGCGILVWRLLCRLFQGRLLPLLGALLFIAHPLQTQSVNYLVQRATLLAAFFFLLAIVNFLRARELLLAGTAWSAPAHLRPYLAALFFGACALLSKENAATLPLVLFAGSLLLAPLAGCSVWPTLRYCLPFCVMPLLLGAQLIVPLLGAKNAIVYAPLASLAHNSPLHYFVTQFTVMWVYMRLLVFPYGQALEYDYPVAAQLLQMDNFLALAGLLVLAGGAWGLRKGKPIIAFGIFWFFLTISVESSFIPLDPVFEHRLYLPITGYIAVVLSLMAIVSDKRIQLMIGSIIIAIFAFLTWERNQLWRDPIALYENNLKVVRNAERVVVNLGSMYIDRRQYEKAIAMLEENIKKYNNQSIYNNLAYAYCSINKCDMAISLLETAIDTTNQPAEIYQHLSNIYRDIGKNSAAIEVLVSGLSKEWTDKDVLNYEIGCLYLDREDYDTALDHFRAVSLDNYSIKIKSDINISGIYLIKNDIEKSKEIVGRILKLEPWNPDIIEKAFWIHLGGNDRRTAGEIVDRLRFIDPGRWERLRKIASD